MDFRRLNMNKNRTLILSIAFTTVFALALLLLTLFVPWIVEFLCVFFHRNYLIKFLTVVTYLAVPAGWGAIILLYKLLINVKKGIVFTEDNVKSLSILSWLCFYVGLLSGFSSHKFAMFIIVSISALFIGLIVRVVKNIISKAIEIKEENDMTV